MKRLLILGMALACTGMAFAQRPATDDRAELPKIREELRRAEEMLEVVKRVLPPEFDPVGEESSLRKLATAANLAAPEIRIAPKTARLPLEDGTASPLLLHRVELSGRDAFEDVYLFLSMVESRPRFARLESMKLEAADQDTVRFSAQLVFPTLTEDPVPAPPVNRDVLAALRQELARKRATVQSVTQYLDPAQRQPALHALAALEDELANQPMALSEVIYDGNLLLRGVRVGRSAGTTMASALAKAGLRKDREQLGRSGMCETFVITARIESGDRSPLAVLDNGLFDSRAIAVCAEKPSPLAPPLSIGSGSTFLRLEEVDLVDVFFALSDLLHQAFVVDSDVTGRISVTVSTEATIDELLEGIRGTGLRIGAGPVRRVSRAVPVSAGRANNAVKLEDPVSFMIKDAEVADVLCVFASITGRQIEVPAGQQARISVFALEAPLNQLFDGVIDTAGLVTTTAGPTLVLRKRADSAVSPRVNVCDHRSSAPPTRLASIPLSLNELSVADVTLAGLANLGESWRAYVYGPSRKMLVIEPGGHLLDATVKSVGPNGITLTRHDGKIVVLAFQP